MYVRYCAVMTSEPSSSAKEPNLASLVSSSLISFKKLASTLRTDDSKSSRVSYCLMRFKLWASNLGAHVPYGSRSLEYRLRDATQLRKYVVSLLRDLCATIEEGD